MEPVETGKDKVKKICEVLRKETLEPAVQEARSILEQAEEKASQILSEAKTKAASIIKEAEKTIESKQAVFQASLHQGARQVFEWIKQEIKEHLLNKTLSKKVTKAMQDPQVLASLLTALVKALEKEGLKADFSAVIAESVEPSAINALLSKEILEELREKSVIIGDHKGGIELKVHEGNFTIDLTDQALLGLISQYIRKDFQKYFFDFPHKERG